MIYTYVFSGNKWAFKNWTPAARRNSAKENDLGLLFTCRQLHTETALLPYTLGRFTFRMIYVIQEQGEDRVDDFLEERSDEQLAAIGSLALMGYDEEIDEYTYVRGTGEYRAERVVWV